MKDKGEDLLALLADVLDWLLQQQQQQKLDETEMWTEEKFTVDYRDDVMNEKRKDNWALAEALPKKHSWSDCSRRPTEMS